MQNRSYDESIDKITKESSKLSCELVMCQLQPHFELTKKPEAYKHGDFFYSDPMDNESLLAVEMEGRDAEEGEGVNWPKLRTGFYKDLTIPQRKGDVLYDYYIVYNPYNPLEFGIINSMDIPVNSIVYKLGEPWIAIPHSQIYWGTIDGETGDITAHHVIHDGDENNQSLTQPNLWYKMNKRGKKCTKVNI